MGCEAASCHMETPNAPPRTSPRHDMKSITRTDERILQGDIFERDAKPPRLHWGHLHEPGRDIPMVGPRMSMRGKHPIEA